MVAPINILLLQIRRSSANITMLLAAVTIWLHIVLRPTSWRYEWLRVFDSFHLVTLLVCPIFAGLAAWDGIRHAKARNYLWSGNRQYRALLVTFLATVSGPVCSYLLGLCVVIAYALFRGLKGLPQPADILTVVPALGLVLLSVAAGFAAGWRTRSPYIVPLAAFGFFIWLMLSFELPGVFVEVGGASGTLIGLAPKVHIQLAQTALFAALTVLSLACCLQSWRRDRRLILALGATTLLVFTSACIIVASGGFRFEAAPVKLLCEPAEQRLDRPSLAVCLHDSYESFRDPIRVEFEAPLVQLASTGLVTPPSKITMDPNDTAPGSTYLDPLTFPFGDPYAPVNVMMSALIPEQCDIFASQKLSEAYTGLVFWLHAASGQVPNVDDPSIPVELLDWQTPEAERWVVQNISLLAACP